MTDTDATKMKSNADIVLEYWDCFKYVTAKRIEVQTTIRGYDVKIDKAHLKKCGTLIIEQGYPWDGNSGPFPDITKTKLPSCAHDPLCDMINLGLLPVDEQPKVDQLYYDLSVEARGLNKSIARLIVLSIRWYMLHKGTARFRRKLKYA